MTDEYEALRKAAEKATPGPWKSRKGFDSGTREIFRPDKSVKPPFYPSELAVIDTDIGENGGANARYLAAADPTTILTLLAERDALRGAAAKALHALEQLNEIDTETESVTIYVSDEIDALWDALGEPTCSR